MLDSKQEHSAEELDKQCSSGKFSDRPAEIPINKLCVCALMHIDMLISFMHTYMPHIYTQRNTPTYTQEHTHALTQILRRILTLYVKQSVARRDFCIRSDDS